VNPGEAMQVLQALANGVDTSTGEIFVEQHPFNHSQVIRALFYPVHELEKRHKPARSAMQPGNAEKPWTKEEDASLLEGLDAGVGSQTADGEACAHKRRDRIPPGSSWTAPA